MTRGYHIHIIALLIAAAGIISCGKEPLSSNSKEEWHGYIHFGAGDMDKTKASNIVESFDDPNLTDKDFGVIAFQYSASSDWNTFKATGTPASSSFPFAMPVRHNAGIWSYDASSTNGGVRLVDWDNSSKYTFFAYYPYGYSQLTTETTQTTAGVPRMAYTMPVTTDPSTLRDVMIASVKDAQNNSDGTVYFHFRHCLSCLTIVARNLDKVGETGAVDQTIKDMELFITSNIYKKLSIPMDYTMESTPSETLSGAHYTYSNTSTAITVPLIANEGTDKDVIKVVPVSGENNVFLIPQKATGANGHLRGCISFTDRNGKIQTGDSSKDGVNGYNYDQSLQFDSDKDFEAGRRYSIVINFANGKISVAIIESGDWEDVNIDHTFE